MVVIQDGVTNASYVTDSRQNRAAVSIKGSGTNKRLLQQQQQLTLQRCIDICESSEASSTQIKSLRQSEKEKVRKVKENEKKRCAKKTARKRQG